VYHVLRLLTQELKTVAELDLWHWQQRPLWGLPLLLLLLLLLYPLL
jgi:hypothetical protein